MSELFSFNKSYSHNSKCLSNKCFIAFIFEGKILEFHICFKTLDYYLILMCMHLEFPNNNFLLIMFLLKYSNTNQCFFLYIQMLIDVSSLFNWPMTHKDVDFTNKPISLVLGQLGV